MTLPFRPAAAGPARPRTKPAFAPPPVPMTGDAADADALMTPRQVADLLTVAPATLEKWRRLGQGPAFVKLSGRVVRYRRSDVGRFLDGAAR